VRKLLKNCGTDPHSYSSGIDPLLSEKKINGIDPFPKVNEVLLKCRRELKVESIHGKRSKNGIEPFPYVNEARLKN
jgi:hypothetical protein